MTDEQTPAAVVAEADAPTMAPEKALEWVDTAVEEFFGSIEECARHMSAGSLEEIVVSAKLNAFMLRLMSIAQTGQAEQQRAAEATA